MTQLAPESKGISPPRFGDVRGLWCLDPEIIFLNHGSFGATPREVLDAQNRYRLMIEGRPIELLGRRVDQLLAPTREAIAGLVGVDADAVGLTTNATEAINGVLNSLRFNSGDELLTTSHVYPAVRQAMRFAAERWGAKVVEADIQAPIRSASGVMRAIELAITKRTRLAVIDHITSPTAIVFPIDEIVRLCRDRGVPILVDGAHGPGMSPLDIQRMQPDYYVANLHKWVCAPKGCAFLWARADRRDEAHPAVVSHFLGKGFKAEFGWQGTRDITAWMAATDAIAFWRKLGLERMMAHNHHLATWAHGMLCDAWGIEPASPRDGSMLGSMASIPLPNDARKYGSTELFQRDLYERYRIEVPLFDWGGRWWIRVSCQVYNVAEEYETLARAVNELVRR